MRKQRDIMLKTSAQRQAEARINDLLSGAKSLLDQDYSQFDDLKPIRPATKAPPTTTEPAPNHASLDRSTSEVLSTPASSFSRRSASHHDHTLPASSSSSALQEKAQTIPNSELKLPLSQLPDRPSSPRSLGSARSTQSRKPLVPEEPSRRAKEVVNMNFSSEFIVAATEKKKRFYPSKKPTESADDRRERERQERRKQAMERLLRRRQEQAAAQARLKEKRRREKLSRASAEDRDTSDSESVSGGDDDHAMLDGAAADVAIQAQTSSNQISIQESIHESEVTDDQLIDSLVQDAGAIATAAAHVAKEPLSSSLPNGPSASSSISNPPIRNHPVKTRPGRSQAVESSDSMRNRLSCDSKQAAKKSAITSVRPPTDPRPQRRRHQPTSSTTTSTSEGIRNSIDCSTVIEDVCTQSEESLLPEDLVDKNIAALSAIRRMKALKVRYQ